MSTSSTGGLGSIFNAKTLEDWLPWFISVTVALAGFRWSSLIPGTNSILVAAAFGFLAKFLTGIAQNGWDAWEDWVPTLIISLGFLGTALESSPDYVVAGTVIGFLVKALGSFQTPSSTWIEDAMLAVGAFLIAYGQYANYPTLVSIGALIALIGKTVPSIQVNSSATTTTSTITTTTTPSTTPPTSATSLVPLESASPPALIVFPTSTTSSAQVIIQ